MNDVKAGVFTSEFWLTLITYAIVTVLTVANSMFDLGVSVWDIAITVIPHAVYVLNRMGVKIFSGVSIEQVKELIGGLRPVEVAPKAVPGKPINVSIPQGE